MPAPFSQKQIEATAADWLARRDRGLTAAEQDEFLQWRGADPRHAAALARHERTLQHMMRLGSWEPLVDQDPNPDLFASPRRRTLWRRLALPLSLAVAAAAALLLYNRAPPAPVALAPDSTSRYLRVNERQALTDGSLVELKDGSRIEVHYSATERRVNLIGGEAHFTVTKNPERPFVVAVEGVAIRAVGTAFNVRLDPAEVDVLVTEGRVEVTGARAASPPAGPAATPPPAATVDAGQRTLVPVERPAPQLEVSAVTSAQMQAALAWQQPRLQFLETPLGEAVAEFNRHAARRQAPRLVLGHPSLAHLPIGGTFRIDNVRGFVRLLEITLQIRAEERGAEIVLTRER